MRREINYRTRENKRRCLLRIRTARKTCLLKFIRLVCRTTQRMNIFYDQRMHVGLLHLNERKKKITFRLTRQVKKSYTSIGTQFSFKLPDATRLGHV